MTTPREYAIALQYVQVNYRELYSLAAAIVLAPGRMFPLGQEGQCSHDNFITIADNLHTTGDYVNVLVHELTHAKQNATRSTKNSQQREEEAYEAGNLAALHYLSKAAPWVKQ